MNFAKKLLRGGSLLIMRASLLLLPPLIAAVVVFGDSQHIKQIVRDSKVYDNTVSAILDQSVIDNTDDQAKELLNDPGVRKVVNDAFSSAYIKSTTEQTTDSMYAWLEGKTKQPEFSIDISQPLQQLNTSLTAYAKQRADTLPVCTAAQLKSLGADLNILSLPCLPPGFDTGKAAAQFSSDIMSSTNMLNTQKFTTASLPKNESGKNVFQELSYLSTIYKLFMFTPYLLGGLALFMGTVFILLCDSRRTGVQKVAWALIGSGVFWLLGVALYMLMLANIHVDLSGVANSGLRASITALVSQITRELNTATGTVAGIYTLTGIVAALAIWRFWHKTEQTSTGQAPSAQTPVLEPQTNNIPAKPEQANEKIGEQQ